MKWIKTLMIVLASLPGVAILTMIPAKSFAAFHSYVWRPFWQRLLDVLLKALEIYLDTVIKRGYFLAPVPGNQIATVFEGESNLTGPNGLAYDGQILTVPQDIVIYVKDDVGVALQEGEYQLDANGNFNLKLIRVLSPTPSPTFPLPAGGEN